MKAYNNFFFLLMVLIFLFSSGCDKCPSELQIEPTSILPDGLDVITRHFDKQVLTFIDEDYSEVQFTLEDSFEGFERIYFDHEATCDNGTKFRPYKIREKRSRTYVSNNADTIVIFLLSHTWSLVSQESRIDSSPVPIIGDGFFGIRLAFVGCEPFEGGRLAIDSEGNSEIITTPFPLVKHGQYHDDIFNLGTERWVHGLNFSLSQGLITFNYCGKDYAQVVD